MSEKKLKIIAVVLTVAAFICLAIGTAFAVDFMAEHPDEFACDLKRPVVAANRPLVDPVVEPPLMDFLVPDSMVGTWYVDYAHLPDSAENYFILDLTAAATTFVVIYNDVTYENVNNVALNSEPSFSYSVEQDDFVDVSPVSSFYIVIESSTVRFFDDSENLVNPGTVISVFPDGFLTRVESPSGVEITGAIVEILVSGLTSTGEAIGQGLSTLAEFIFINADGTGLSTFGILIVVFSAVSLGLSLTRWVLNFCSSWGKRNR